MTFAVAAESYDRFMGRYSVPLAPRFADFAGVSAGQRVLDVGCGPGALTRVLVDRLGPSAVTAVDPSESFVAAARARHDGVDVRHARAEELPFEGATFHAALAQLVVHFMDDPVAGLREMARVTRPGGIVAACVWDLEAGGQGPLGVFWQGARDLDDTATGEGVLPGGRQGHLGELFREAGIADVVEGDLTVRVEHRTFDEWWEPYTLGVGPAGAHTARLEPSRLAELREHCRALLPDPPFLLTARAWAARGASRPPRKR